MMVINNRNGDVRRAVFGLRTRTVLGGALLAGAVLCGGQLASAQVVQGDYDLDGKSDLAVANIDKTANTTTFLARSSSGAPNKSFLFAGAADAIVTGKWFSDRKTYPGMVRVTDPKLPLEWRIKNPQGGENVFRFGLQGDTVPNVAFDLDRDGVTDPVVVRNGVPGYYEGYKLWYVALSSAGGGVYETLFGLASDKPFVGQDESGLGRLYVLREGTYTWYGRSLFGSEVSAVQWGLAGDIGIAPQPIGGQHAHIIVRPFATGQVAFVRLPGGVLKTVALGGVSTLPVVGNFFGLGNDFGWFDLNQGTVGVKLPDGNTLPVVFGAQGQTVVAPNGQVSASTETPGSKGDFGGCENVVSIGDLPGILYKPINEHGGRGPTLIIKAKSRRTGRSTLEIRNVNCERIGALGLQSAEGPYGERYYSRTGKGTKYSHTQLRDIAKQAGSTNILIEGKGIWILVNNPANREGRL